MKEKIVGQSLEFLDILAKLFTILSRMSIFLDILAKLLNKKGQMKNKKLLNLRQCIYALPESLKEDLVI